MTGQFFKNEEGTIFYVSCFGRKRLFSISLNNLLNGKDFVVKQDLLSTKLGVQTKLLVIDSLIIGNTVQNKITFTYNINNKQVSFWDYYPEISFISSLDDHERFTLYCKRFIYNKSHSLIAGSFFTYFNSLIFYTPEGKRVKSIKLPTFNFNLKTKASLGDAPGYCTSIVNGFNNIYMSYYEYPNIENNKGVINIFDWEGKALKQYLIKNTFLHCFVVDEINHKIYGYSPENEENEMSPIIEFDL